MCSQCIELLSVVLFHCTPLYVLFFIFFWIFYSFFVNIPVFRYFHGFFFSRLCSSSCHRNSKYQDSHATTCVQICLISSNLLNQVIYSDCKTSVLNQNHRFLSTVNKDHTNNVYSNETPLLKFHLSLDVRHFIGLCLFHHFKPSKKDG